MATPPSNQSVSSGGSRRTWLLLLLILLILVLLVYDHGAAKHYGEQAYTKATRATHKVSNWARELYACGIPGCGPKSGNASTATVQTEPGKVAVADQNTNVAPAAPSAEPAAGAADTQAPAPATAAPGDQAQTPAGGNYPAYPAYPAYPNYPPDSSFGNQGSSVDSAPPSGPASEMSPSPAAPAVASAPPAQPYLQPLTPPKPSKPETAPGKPEYPDYPAYPQHPSATTSPPMPPAAIGAPPRAPKSDQRPAPVANDAAGADSLALARNSALVRRLGDSVHEYLRYLTAHPNDVDAYGELGNVYMKIGRFPEAAQNYYEAATRLIDAGQINAVASLMPVIQMYEPMLATLLNKKIANAMGENQGYRR